MNIRYGLIRPALALFFFLILFPSLSYSGSSSPNQIDYRNYFLSENKDSTNCQLEVSSNNKVKFSDSVWSPAMTCPDAYSWMVFIEAVQNSFWKNWSYDGFIWPQQPYPLCEGKNTKNCCTPGAKNNPGYNNSENPGLHCPYFPGNFSGLSQQKRVGIMFPFKQKGTPLGHKSPITANDPGRTIRQEMSEVVFKNKPLVDYVFENNLYNQEGLSAVFNAASQSLETDSPYRIKTVDGVKTEISFPYGSVMIKSDWLYEEEANKLGLFNTPEAPYVTMYIESPIANNDGPNTYRKGIHYLVAMTVSAKATPNWLWFAIEHVNNPGRCDYTGCNDSYGYKSSAKLPSNAYDNYTPPHTENDNLILSSEIFDLAKPYPAETIKPNLAQVFKKVGMGQKDDNDPNIPSLGDKAWLSYRLKGAMNEFVQNSGHPNIVGNTVTEAGFVNTSSCMTCHTRAAVNAEGVSSTRAAGFIRNLNITGYNMSPNGAPDLDWFYTNDSPPALTGVRTDYVWGILFANPLHAPGSDNSK